MDRQYTHVIILDFEATCDDQKLITPQEIIEFPSVLIALDTLETVDEFSSFVRPVLHPTLTKFCTDLTSIKQSDVNKAPIFPDVFKKHEEWLDQHHLTGQNTFFITCGEWDFNIMFPAQCPVSEPPIETLRPIYTKWLNIKKLFCTVMDRAKAPGMARMMKDLKLPLTGHHHRGIDDCRNIAKIFLKLIEENPTIEPSSKLSASKYPPIHLTLQLGDATEVIKLNSRNMNGLWSIAQKTFRSPIASFQQMDGTDVCETEQLLSLQSGETLILTAVKTD